jgi:hypothetical protein
MGFKYLTNSNFALRGKEATMINLFLLTLAVAVLYGAWRLVPPANPTKVMVGAAVRNTARWVGAVVLTCVGVWFGWLTLTSWLATPATKVTPTIQSAPAKPAPAVSAPVAPTQTVTPRRLGGWELRYTSPNFGLERFSAELSGGEGNLVITQFHREGSEEIRTVYAGPLLGQVVRGEWAEQRPNPARGRFWLKFQGDQSAEGMIYYFTADGHEREAPLTLVRN